MAKSEQFNADVNSILEAFKQGGKEKANAEFRRLERKLVRWEAIVLQHFAAEKISEFQKNSLASAQSI